MRLRYSSRRRGHQGSPGLLGALAIARSDEENRIRPWVPRSQTSIGGEDERSAPSAFVQVAREDQGRWGPMRRNDEQCPLRGDPAPPLLRFAAARCSWSAIARGAT